MPIRQEFARLRVAWPEACGPPGPVNDKAGPQRILAAETLARVGGEGNSFSIWAECAQQPIATLATVGQELRAEIVRAVVTVLDDRFHDPSLCMKHVAAQVGRTEWEVSRALFRNTGKGFREHLRRRRVDAARRQLANDDIALKVIATQAGFSTPSQFTRQFLREEGMTPTQFRNEIKSGKKGKAFQVA